MQALACVAPSTTVCELIGHRRQLRWSNAPKRSLYVLRPQRTREPWVHQWPGVHGLHCEEDVRFVAVE